MTKAIKLPRSSMRARTFGQLKVQQGGACGICGKPIDLTVKGNKSDYVQDHDHETGLIRGVLHRSCNAAEGKVLNAAGRWGSKDTSIAATIEWLRAMVAYHDYWRDNPSNLIYPDHKTDEQKQELARKRRREADARRRAKQRMQEIR